MTTILNYEEPSHVAVAQALPVEMLDGARAIEEVIVATFPDTDELNRSFCATVALATWVYELDKERRLEMSPREVAYVYQAGRMAAQEVARHLVPRLQSTVESMDWARF
ncbi:hypothetical protein [Devosia sp.]|uniref:hypothetical protein n=1 Tax=Devosia sp. TaxID=1871048 RepID=UPI00260EE8EC|nr:hypothetical protein [Devosia sp.]